MRHLQIHAAVPQLGNAVAPASTALTWRPCSNGPGEWMQCPLLRALRHLPVGEVHASPASPIACAVGHPDRVLHPPIRSNSRNCERRRPISATPTHSQAWCAPPLCRRPAPWLSALLFSVPALARRRPWRARARLVPSAALSRPATPRPPASGTRTPPCPREERRERGGRGRELLGWVPVALPPAAALEQPSGGPLPPMVTPSAAMALTP